MGGGNSKAGKQELNLTYETIKETTLNVMSKNQTRTTQTGQSKQSITITNTAFYCTGAEIGNEATIDMELEVEIDAQLETELIANLQSELENKIDQDQASSTGFGAGLTSMGGGNTQGGDMTTTIKNEIRDTLNTTLTQENLTEIIQNATNDQTIEAEGLVFDPCNKRLEMEMYNASQDMKLDMIARMGSSATPAAVQLLATDPPDMTCDLPCGSITNISTITLAADAVTDAVMEALVENETISNVYNDIAMKSANETAGVEDVVDSWFGGIAGIFTGILDGLMWPLIIAIVAIVIIAIVYKSVAAQAVNKYNVK